MGNVFSLPHLLLLISFETRQRKLQRNSYSQMALYTREWNAETGAAGQRIDAPANPDEAMDSNLSSLWRRDAQWQESISLDDLISSSHSLWGALVISDPYFTNV